MIGNPMYCKSCQHQIYFGLEQIIYGLDMYCKNCGTENQVDIQSAIELLAEEIRDLKDEKTVD